MRNLLIGIAMLHGGLFAAGERDDRRVGQKRVLQAGREVRRTDRLREANRRTPGDPGVAVGHVSDGLFAMAQYAGDAERAKLDQGAAQHRVDEEDMRGAVGGQAAREKFGTGDRFGCGHLGSLRAIARRLGPRVRRDNLSPVEGARR